VTLIAITLAMLVINAWTVLAFWQDKRCAIIGARRIPERELLTLAAVGGSPGAMLARRMFRHKTRKEPFSTQLLLILVLQSGGLIGWFLL
jgi:uncharacterized membrane protein YsdA (DUF1294 family)